MRVGSTYLKYHVLVDFSLDLSLINSEYKPNPIHTSIVVEKQVQFAYFVLFLGLSMARKV